MEWEPVFDNVCLFSTGCSFYLSAKHEVSLLAFVEYIYYTL